MKETQLEQKFIFRKIAGHFGDVYVTASRKKAYI